MGATTKFSASEAADAMGYMALAGWDDAQVIAGIPGVLNLAAAANMDLAKALGYRDRYIDSVRHGGGRAGEAADVFAYAQANSNTTVEGLGEAMKYAAPTADAFGMTLRDTAAAMGVLANAGIKGRQGGDAQRDAARHEEQRQEQRNRYQQNQSRADQCGTEAIARMPRSSAISIKATSSTDRQPARRGAGRQSSGDESLKGIWRRSGRGPDALDAMTEGMWRTTRRGGRYSCHDGRQPQGRSGDLESARRDMAIALSDWLDACRARGVVRALPI